jgi:Flp pilus assembly pilin Flp
MYMLVVAAGTVIGRVIRSLPGAAVPWPEDGEAAGPIDADERGQGLAEYALILAFVAIAVIGALAFFGQQLQAVLWDPISADIGDVIDGMGP